MIYSLAPKGNWKNAPSCCNQDGAIFFTQMEEIWKDVPGYPDYMVSNLGRIKSMKFGKERILKPYAKKKNGYLVIALSVDRMEKRIFVHQLVAKSFLDYDSHKIGMVIDHINHEVADNRVANLRIITNRENSAYKKKKTSSNFVGVYLSLASGKWVSSIMLNGKRKHLGVFTSEKMAAQAYQTALEAHKNKTNES